MKAFRITQIALSHDGTTYPEGSVVVPEPENEGLIFVLEQRLEAGSAEEADPADAPLPSSAFQVALDELAGHALDLFRRAVAFLPLAEAEGPGGPLAIAAAVQRLKADFEDASELQDRFEALAEAVTRALEESEVGGQAGSAGAEPEAGGDAGGRPPAEPPTDKNNPAPEGGVSGDPVAETPPPANPEPTGTPATNSTARKGGAKAAKA